MSHIYWDDTYNPIVMRCSPVAAGCAHCWHIKYCNRHAKNPKFREEHREVYAGLAPPLLIQKRVDAPFRWRKHRERVVVQLMGDICHEDIPDMFLDIAFFPMFALDDTNWIVLTKRIKRFREWVERKEYQLPEHIWVGVSISTDDDLWMVEELLKIPAAVRWVSIEPMLEAIDLAHVEIPGAGKNNNFLTGSYCNHPALVLKVGAKIDWVVMGAESGAGARHIGQEKMIATAKQVKDAGVPLFVKQIYGNGFHVPLHKLISDIDQFPEALQFREFPA